MGLSESDLRTSADGRQGWLLRLVSAHVWSEALTLSLPKAGLEKMAPNR
jgi:hypothetical protein